MLRITPVLAHAPIPLNNALIKEFLASARLCYAPNPRRALSDPVSALLACRPIRSFARDSTVSSGYISPRIVSLSCCSLNGYFDLRCFKVSLPLAMARTFDRGRPRLLD